MFIINAYKRQSRGAKALAKALKGRRYRTGDEVRPNDIIINWGDGKCTLNNVLNQPSAVEIASNKKKSFEIFAAKGVPVPRFATGKETVTWSGKTVCRHKLTGHSGEGIEIVESGKELPDAPLYVEYKKKMVEYRIHVGTANEETRVITVQRKARDLSVPDECVNWEVRNHSNGFVFAREGAYPNNDVVEAACNAIRAIGLDFGAVDIIWNEHERKAYVLEINTAPGLEGQTIEDYAEFFRSHTPCN